MKLNKLYFPIILTFVTFIFFGRVICFDFLTFDDNFFITENPVIADSSTSIIDCISYQFKQPNYFPLSNLMFRLERMIFGFNPKVFHGLNLLLYVVNVLLVYFLSLKILNRLEFEKKQIGISAFIIALFFALHPIHVESVAWVIDLKDLLYTCFYLLGILFYWRWLELRKVKFVVWAVVFSILSLLSKSTAITFVGILFLIDWAYSRKFTKEQLLIKIPFIAVAFFGLYIFGILSNVTQTMNGFSGEAAQLFNAYYPSPIDQMNPVVQQLFIIFFRITFWISQSIIPFQQTVMYSRTMLLDQYSAVIIFMPLVVIVLAIWAIANRKTGSYLFFGFVFFLITILPSLAQSDIGVSVFTPDRYLYLPVLGILFILVGIIQKQPRWLSIVLFVFLGLFWSYRTLVYLPVWKTSESLYNHVIKIDPDAQVALLNRSNIYLERGDVDLAFIDLNKLAGYSNQPVEVYLNRGKIFLDRDEMKKALNDFNTAICIDSLCLNAYLNRGVLFLKQDELTKARTDFSKAYDFDSTDYLLNKNIALLYNKAQNFKVAISFCNACKAIDSTDIDIDRMKAIAFYNLRDFNKSNELLSTVLKSDSLNGELFYLRARSRYNLKDFDGALIDLKIAKERNAIIDELFEYQLSSAIENVNNK